MAQSVTLSVTLAGDGCREVLRRRTDRKTRRRITGFLEVFQVPVGVAGFTLGGGAENSRDVVVTLDVGLGREIQVASIRLRLTGEDRPGVVHEISTAISDAGISISRLGTVTDLPLDERKRLLRLLYREHPAVRYVTHVDEHGVEFQAAVAAQGLEGSIAKHRRSRYQPGVRSREWLKVKARREQELVVIGYEPGQGRAKELGSVLVATRDGDAWRFAGHVGSGIDERARGILRGFVWGDQAGCWQHAACLMDINELILATFEKPDWVHEKESA